MGGRGVVKWMEGKDMVARWKGGSEGLIKLHKLNRESSKERVRKTECDGA